MDNDWVDAAVYAYVPFLGDAYKPQTSWRHKRCQGCGEPFGDTKEAGRLLPGEHLPLYFHYDCAYQAVIKNLPQEEWPISFRLVCFFKCREQRALAHLS